MSFAVWHKLYNKSSSTFFGTPQFIIYSLYFALEGVGARSDGKTDYPYPYNIPGDSDQHIKPIFFERGIKKISKVFFQINDSIRIGEKKVHNSIFGNQTIL